MQLPGHDGRDRNGHQAQAREQAVLAADPSFGKWPAPWMRALERGRTCSAGRVGQIVAGVGALFLVDRQSRRRSSESGIATLVRLRGKRRGARFAGSLGSSSVAFRGIKPDPATAIQAVTGSGFYDG